MPKITFLPHRRSTLPLVVEVEEGTSILDASEEHGGFVGSACGGVCACSTCHVKIKQGQENLSEMQDDESDRLDMAFDVTLESRLGCQAKVHGDVVVEVTEESLETWGNEHPEMKDKQT